MGRESKLTPAICTALAFTVLAISTVILSPSNHQHRLKSDLKARLPILPSFEAAKCRVAVHNEHGYHMDVMAGAVVEFQNIGCSVDIYFAGDKFNTRGLLQPVFRGTYNHFSLLSRRAADYSTVLIVTFPSEQALAYMSAASQNATLKQTFVALTHSPDSLVAPPVLDLITVLQSSVHKSIQLATLAPATSRYTEGILRTHGIELEGGVRTLVTLPPFNASTSAVLARLREGQEEALNICIQGSFDPERRNYTQAFAAVQHLAPVLQQRGERLLVMGTNVASKLPPSMQGLAQELPAMDFEAYFAALARCRALLAAFGGPRYYSSKVSSTVLVALNLGVPLVATTRTLEAYPYLPADGLLLYDDAQAGGFEGAVLAALGSTTRHRRALAAARQRVVEANRRVVMGFVGAAGGA